MFDERYQDVKTHVAFVSFYKRTAPSVHYKGKERIVEDKEIDYIHIRTPGDTKLEYEGPVTDDHKKRFPTEWAAYQKGASFESGTPLDEWPFLTNSEIEFLQKRGAAYVEHIAHWPDAGIKDLGPNGYSLRKKAQEWLDQRGDESVVLGLQEQIDELKEMLARVKAADQTVGVEQGTRDKPEVGNPTVAATSSPSSAPASAPSSSEPPPDTKPGKGKGRGRGRPPKK